MPRNSPNLDETTAPEAGVGASPPVGLPLPTLTGYQLLSELGRGGMGVVYKARQTSQDRLVAVKLIRDSSLASEQDRVRFRIEAEAAARMQHPNLIQVLDAGEDSGRPYFAMELIEGGSLDQYLNGKPVPPVQSAELIRALAEAVEHAHRQQIVHRDLKPANILLAQHPATVGTTITPENWSRVAIPKITDFGLAKRLDHDSTALTQSGTVLGTAAYMAPEQAAGRVNEMGPAVDIYALGAILYELLTGRPPFVSESWNAVLDQVMRSEPLPPSHWHQHIPSALETVCLKCLEKQAAQRYGSAHELAEDLQRFLSNAPVKAVRLSEKEQIVRLARQEGYEILDEVGQGPGSIVFRARYQSLQQPVALKVFTQGNIDRVAWDAQLQQATLSWSMLSHPLLLLNQRAGWLGNKRYASTEFSLLGSLSEKIGSKPWPVEDAIFLVEHLAEAVSYLHRQGVTHGNLKPSNILLTAGNLPRLIDFHQLAGWYLTDMNPHNQTGYDLLAPELIKNPGSEPNISADLYGLGMILYILLTSKSPFDGASVSELREQVLNVEPVSPSQFNPKVPTPLDLLCQRCLNKSPYRRMHRAYDIITKLQFIRQNEFKPRRK